MGVGGVTTAAIFSELLDRAEETNWAGADPYDGLASRLGTLIIPLGQFPRFVLSQAVLRSPFIRRIANPASKENPKGLALFLGAATQGRASWARIGRDRCSSGS